MTQIIPGEKDPKILKEIRVFLNFNCCYGRLQMPILAENRGKNMQTEGF